MILRRLVTVILLELMMLALPLSAAAADWPAIQARSIELRNTGETTTTKIDRTWVVNRVSSTSLTGILQGYLAIGGTAYNSSRLNGFTSSSFSLVGHTHSYLPLNGKAQTAGAADTATLAITSTNALKLGGVLPAGYVTTPTLAATLQQSYHRFAAVGDSITSGVGGGVWTSNLMTLWGSPWVVMNYGVPGIDSATIASIMNTSVLPNTTFYGIFIWGGVNDCQAGTAAATIEATLQGMYTAAHNDGLKVIAFTISPWKGVALWTSGKQGVADTVNSWIMNTAINIDYKINAYSLLVDPSNAYTLLPAYDDGDHIHPNAAGGLVIANSIYATMTLPTVPTFSRFGNNGIISLTSVTRIRHEPSVAVLPTDNSSTAWLFENSHGVAYFTLDSLLGNLGFLYTGDPNSYSAKIGMNITPGMMQYDLHSALGNNAQLWSSDGVEKMRLTYAGLLNISGPATATVVNATTSINTGAGAGTARIDNNGNVTAGTLAGTTTTLTGGGLAVATAGYGLSIKGGSNAMAGITAAMTAGTVTVATTAVRATDVIQLTERTAGGVKGVLSYTIIPGTSFTITSSSAADISTVGWIIFHVN